MLKHNFITTYTSVHTHTHTRFIPRLCDMAWEREHTHTYIQCLSYADSLYDVEATQSSGDEDSWQLGVPMKFLDLQLALVDEQQLWRDISPSLSFSATSIFVLLHCQVPLNNLEVAMTTQYYMH